MESQRAGEQRTVMLDFGYTPDILLNNNKLLVSYTGARVTFGA